MRNWSIISDNVRYIQHQQKAPPKLNVDTLDYRQHKELYFKLKGEERKSLDVDFGIYADVLKSKYLDMYEGIYAKMVYANKFNENSDLGTTYLGQTKMTRDAKLEQKNDFLLLAKDLLQENYWMVQNVKFCWTWVPPSPTCQNLTICDAKLYMHYQNFLLTLKGFR